MDSCNSGGSLSSSGGADDDFDTRNEPISSFLNPSFNNNPNPNPNTILQPPPPSSSSDNHQPPPTHTHFFDPFSNTNPNPVFNLDHVWARNMRPDHNFNEFGSDQTGGLLASEQGMYPNQSTVDNQNPGVGSDRREVVKNPKKRTRASRRAPTTVLTTDTTNFRQMVQEFTGIPAGPFSSASSSTFSRRMDLFGGGGVGPVFPLRPSAQKIRQQVMSTGDASSSNYQIPPSGIHDFQKQPQSLLNLQNPVFNFQSLLQTKLPEQVNAPVLGATKSGDQQTEFFPSSSTRWRGQNENLVNFDGGNCNNQNVDGYKLNSPDFHHQTEKGLENVVVSSRNEGNVDSWVCPSD